MKKIIINLLCMVLFWMAVAVLTSTIAPLLINNEDLRDKISGIIFVLAALIIPVLVMSRKVPQTLNVGPEDARVSTAEKTQGNVPSNSDRGIRPLFKLYGAYCIIIGLAAPLGPFFLAALTMAMGGGAVISFWDVYKMYSFLIWGAIPAFVIGYGFLRLRKWVVSCILAQVLIVGIGSIAHYILTYLSMPLDQRAFFFDFVDVRGVFHLLVPALFLVLAIVYRRHLTGKYVSIIPLLLVVLTLVGIWMYGEKTMGPSLRNWEEGTVHVL